MAKDRKRRGEKARDAASLPPLTELPEWDDVHADPAQVEAFERAVVAHGAVESELVMGCVCRLDRGFPAVLTADGPVRAEHAVQIAKDESMAKPAVGDWVALRVPDGHDMAVIEEVLPRRSEVARWRGGKRGERQVLAANVDLVVIAQAEGPRTLSLDRIARSAVIAADSGCAWAVVLTKGDDAPDPERLAADVVAVGEVLGPETPVVVTAGLQRKADPEREAAMAAAAEGAGAAWGVDAVRALVAPGRVAMVLGESGAGKSTLLNALLGRESLETGAVRRRDGAGRHTTVARRMVKLPGAGVVIDCPGLRSLPLVGHERGLAEVFPAIAEAAADCRFRDCTHGSEPGCAVTAAQAEGAFLPGALAAYRALADEMRASADGLDPDVRL